MYTTVNFNFPIFAIFMKGKERNDTPQFSQQVKVKQSGMSIKPGFNTCIKAKSNLVPS